jgi:hypothetical protein
MTTTIYGLHSPWASSDISCFGLARGHDGGMSGTTWFAIIVISAVALFGAIGSCNKLEQTRQDPLGLRSR